MSAGVVESSIEPAARSRTSDARRFHRAGLAGGLVAMFVLTWLATRGFSTLFDEVPLGDFYDAQARSLFHGRWDMPADEKGAAVDFDFGGPYVGEKP